MNSADIYLVPRKKISPNEESTYVSEVEKKCPLCGKYLLDNKNGRINKRYQIAHIYPNSPNLLETSELDGLERLGKNCEDFENKIALCKDCHSYYDDHKTKEEYLKLLGIKKNFLALTEVEKNLSEQNLEQDISIILESLANIKGELKQLKLSALKISRKISDKDLLLKNEIKSNVTMYFLLIKKEFENLSLKGKSNFEIIASQIHTAFLQCEKTISNKSDIFEQLCEWLKSKTPNKNISDQAYRIVISYFVQNCEVFNEITK